MVAKKRRKPPKPYPSFPLTAHPNGQWCKKIRGQVRFFGVWSDAEAALDRYFAEAADLHAGRLPARVAPDGVTIKDASNAYLGWQKAKLDAGEIGPRWFEDCRSVLRDFAKHIGVGRPLKDVPVEELQRYRARLARRLSDVEASVSEESAELARAAGDATAELSRRIVQHDLRTLRSLPTKNG